MVNIKSIIFVLFGLFFSGLLLGCGETTESESETAFRIWPEAVTMKVGEERQFYALSVSGGTIVGVNATFSLSGNVGTITSGGLFSAEAEGVGEIIASYVSDLASTMVTVEAAP